MIINITNIMFIILINYTIHACKLAVQANETSKYKVIHYGPNQLLILRKIPGQSALHSMQSSFNVHLSRPCSWHCPIIDIELDDHCELC